MSIVQQINEGLQALGFSQSLAAQLDQFIAFLGVLLVAYLAAVSYTHLTLPTT